MANEPKKLGCWICEKIFPTLIELQEHQKKEHNQEYEELKTQRDRTRTK